MPSRLVGRLKKLEERTAGPCSCQIAPDLGEFTYTYILDAEPSPPDRPLWDVAGDRCPRCGRQPVPRGALVYWPQDVEPPEDAEPLSEHELAALGVERALRDLRRHAQE